MNEIIEKEENEIKNMIFEIRDKQVMLDSDLAKLYECANGTKTINQAVKRNIERFPNDFYFQLTEEEFLNLWSQIGTANLNNMSRNLPHVFTEQGVAMLSAILKTNKATQISIAIMRTFVEMRHYLTSDKNIYKSITHINSKLLEYDEKFDYLFSKFDKKELLFLKGDTFDSYSNIFDILNVAQNEIILIDAYADITLLDLIRNIKHNIILITRNSNRLSDIEIAKYNNQYNNLTVIRDNSFHDRYFIIDRKYVYLSGSSINNAGSKTFMIIKLEDKLIIKTLLNNINEIVKNHYNY